MIFCVPGILRDGILGQPVQELLLGRSPTQRSVQFLGHIKARTDVSDHLIAWIPLPPSCFISSTPPRMASIINSPPRLGKHHMCRDDDILSHDLLF